MHPKILEIRILSHHALLSAAALRNAYCFLCECGSNVGEISGRVIDYVLRLKAPKGVHK